jgi:hypothetical protein
MSAACQRQRMLAGNDSGLLGWLISVLISADCPCQPIHEVRQG